MTAALELEPPVFARPLRMTDADGVYALVSRCEQADLDEVMIDLEDIVSDWQRPSFDLTTQSIGLFDADDLIGCCEVFRARRAEGYVDPDYRGRGLGTSLMRWTWDVVREGGGALVGQTVPESSDAAALLRSHGYAPLWTSWVLAFPPGNAIAAAQLPKGVRIRPFVPGRDEQAAFRTVEDAFNEWPDRDPAAFDDWVATVPGRPGFEPWQLLLATERDGAVIGVCHLVLSGDSTWINHIAVRRDRRGLGIGRGLLLEAFAAGRSRGAHRAELSTDSRTGALELYRHVGMEVTQTFVHLAKSLG